MQNCHELNTSDPRHKKNPYSLKTIFFLEAIKLFELSCIWMIIEMGIQVALVYHYIKHIKPHFSLCPGLPLHNTYNVISRHLTWKHYPLFVLNDISLSFHTCICNSGQGGFFFLSYIIHTFWQKNDFFNTEHHLWRI
jgi:hypothetical protein